MARCKFKPERNGYENCNRALAHDNKTGFCHVHVKQNRRKAQGVSHAPKAEPPPVPCDNCTDMTPPKRLIGGHCYKCRVALRDPTPKSTGKVPTEHLCSVAGCESRKEYWQTCYEHAVRFDKALLAPRARAEDYMYQNRDIREGVSDGH
jgi:hypothetical protein